MGSLEGEMGHGQSRRRDGSWAVWKERWVMGALHIHPLSCGMYAYAPLIDGVGGRFGCRFPGVQFEISRTLKKGYRW